MVQNKVISKLKPVKKHWKQELTVKILVYCIERNRNLQDMLVWKSNLVLLKSRDYYSQSYQIKPPKAVAGCHGNHSQENLQNSSWVQSLAIDLSSPSLNKLFGIIWGKYHFNWIVSLFFHHWELTVYRLNRALRLTWGIFSPPKWCSV